MQVHDPSKKELVSIIYTAFRSLHVIFILLFNQFLCLRQYLNISVTLISIGANKVNMLQWEKNLKESFLDSKSLWSFTTKRNERRPDRSQPHSPHYFCLG